MWHIWCYFRLLCNILITSEALRQCSFTFYLRASWERVMLKQLSSSYILQFPRTWNSNRRLLCNRRKPQWTKWILLLRLCSSTDQWKWLQYGWCLQVVGIEWTHGWTHFMISKLYQIKMSLIFQQHNRTSLCRNCKQTHWGNFTIFVQKSAFSPLLIFSVKI